MAPRHRVAPLGIAKDIRKSRPIALTGAAQLLTATVLQLQWLHDPAIGSPIQGCFAVTVPPIPPAPTGSKVLLGQRGCYPVRIKGGTTHANGI